MVLIKLKDDIPIWRIKYMPESLDDICGREKMKIQLKDIIKKQNFPHMLFVGANGIGKTTIARIFCKEFLGENFNANYKLIYADIPLTNEERSQAKSEAYISTSKIGSIAGKRITTPIFIQIKVKPFVELKVLGGAPFKILIVKNFDALGNNQQGFRRLMEIYGSNCRMILITTKISGIIDPILSRCQIFLISQVDLKSFRELINKIAINESLKIQDNVIEILYRLSDGKIYQGIDILQLCSLSGKIINVQSLYETYQQFQNDMIKKLLLNIFQGNFSKARDIMRNIITGYKYTSRELFLLLLNELHKLPISKFARSKIINIIADADFRAIDGQDDDIQISALLSKICLFSEYM
ncbi:MAG: AAA family ATPase [Promethearchaeota archaeon]